MSLSNQFNLRIFGFQTYLPITGPSLIVILKQKINTRFSRIPSCFFCLNFKIMNTQERMVSLITSSVFLTASTTILALYCNEMSAQLTTSIKSIGKILVDFLVIALFAVWFAFGTLAFWLITITTIARKRQKHKTHD